MNSFFSVDVGPEEMVRERGGNDKMRKETIGKAWKQGKGWR